MGVRARGGVFGGRGVGGDRRLCGRAVAERRDVGEGAAPGTITVSGERRAVTHSEPLVYDLTDFPG